MFHKLRQTAPFWGRYLTSEIVKNMKTMKIWLEKLLFHHFSQVTLDGPLLRSLFSFRKRKNMKIVPFWGHYLGSESVKPTKRIKIYLKELIFHHFSQATSDGPFLRSSFSFRKRENHENNKNPVKNSFFIIFPKLRQTTPFWGRCLPSKSVKISYIKSQLSAYISDDQIDFFDLSFDFRSKNVLWKDSLFPFKM